MQLEITDSQGSKYLSNEATNESLMMQNSARNSRFQ